MKKGDLVCSKDKSVVGVVIDFVPTMQNVTIAVLWNEPPTAQGCKTFTLHNNNVILLPKGTIIKELCDDGKYVECHYDHYDSKTGVIYDEYKLCNLVILGDEKYDIIFNDDNEVTTKNDPVNHPSHYTQGEIEVIDYIEDKKLGYHLGNVVKYVSRAGHKNNKIEDLKKARWYLDREIKNMEDKNEN